MSVIPPIWLKSVAQRVESRLSEFLQHEQDRWSALDSDLGAPIGELTRLVNAGGKRFRPAFCHLGFIGAGGDETSTLLMDQLPAAANPPRTLAISPSTQTINGQVKAEGLVKAQQF